MVIHFNNNVLKKYPEIYDAIQDKIISKIVYYIIDSKYRKSVNLRGWIEAQVLTPSPKLVLAASKIENKSNYDLQVIEILKWVKTALKYSGDVFTYKMKEHWNSGAETIDTYEGDCEDGAILMYLLCRIKGVPANRLLIAAGSVKGGGHAWLCYKPINYPLNYVFLDWCYWYSSKSVSQRNMFEVIGKTIREFKKSHLMKGAWQQSISLYYNIWFMFNEDKSYPSIDIKNETKARGRFT